MKITFDQLNKRYEDLTAVLRCECVVSTEIVGGVPADEAGIRAFATHHLKIKDDKELDDAVRRIMKEEIGERDVAPENGEIPEKAVYGVNVVRRTEFGPYLGDWMLKANVKQAASRLGIFAQHRGSKGNFAEAGRVRAWKYSLADPDHPNLVYLRNSTEAPANTSFKEFSGRVHSPAGDVSIIHHSECVEPGSRFAFEFRFLASNLKNKLTEDALADLLAMMMICGVGSARALERGKFRIVEAEIDLKQAKPAQSERAQKDKAA